ncbi:MAG: class I SAM-dependent RNA methyltransferase [Sulfitobacter sp.]
MNTHHIARIGLEGDGITDAGLFVPRALPGEEVTGTVLGKYLEDLRIVTPSANRVAPPCRHFKSCGGCQMQHGDDGFVAAWKGDVIRNALTAHGLSTEIRPMITSDARSRRRAGFALKRTKNGAMAGFHARRSDVIIEVPDCILVAPELLAAMPALEQLAIAGASRKAALSAMVTVSAAGLDVSVTGGLPLDGRLMQELAQLSAASGFARLTWDGEVVVTNAAPAQRFGKAAVVPPPGAFLQATAEGEAALLSCVREAVGDAARIVDLFAGCGTFSLPLAEKSAILAVEAEAPMLAALDQGWRGVSGLKPVKTLKRDLFRRPLMKDELKGFDAVVIDPPRAGAEAQVAELVQSAMPVIAYVSCNPVSFARDAAVLCANGYSLNWVQPVDQFRWSSHVELAAQFTKTV